MVKKLFLILLMTVLVGGSILSGCAQPTPAPAPAPTPAPAPKPAPAPAPIELVYAHYLPPTHPGCVYDEMMLAELEKRTAAIGKPVKIEFFYNGALGTNKEILDVLLSGGCDITGASAGHYADRFPIYLTWGGYLRTRSLGLAQFPEIRQLQDIAWYDYELQEEKELKPMGLTALRVGSTMTYHFVSTKPLKNLADFKDVKVRLWSSAYAPMWEAAGTVPISISSSEVYEGLQRGVVDATAYDYISIKDRGFYEIADYVCNVYLSTPFIMQFMRLDRFQSLPPEVQKIWKDLRVEARAGSDKYLQETYVKDRKFLEDAGVTFVDMPIEDIVEWKTRMGDQLEPTLAKARELGVEAEVKEILDFMEPIIEKYEKQIGM
ncbi:TRAP transporter substrate-binding protein [Chloroflexota bacterium]